MTQRGGTRLTDSESETAYEMIDHPSGFPLVKSSTTSGMLHSYRDKNAPKKSYTRKTEYEWEVNNHVPDEEFTLSAFGLPEPKGSKPPAKSQVWVWLSGAVIALIALAILFAWLKRRRLAAVHAKAQVPLNRSSP